MTPDPKEGWEYRYEPATQFIGAYHPKGGARSICHFPDKKIGDDVGPVFAAILNSATIINRNPE